MASALRIKGGDDSSKGLASDDASRPDPFKSYVERVVKLIPAEVVSVYLAGKAGIQAAFPPGATEVSGRISQNAYWVGWTVFCLAAVVLVRMWATADPKNGVKPEWPAIGIATGSFVLWVYSMGDVFALASLWGRPLGIWEPLLASLVVAGWALIIPIFYKD